MKKYVLSFFIMGSLTGLAGCSGEQHAHWGYEGKEGPSKWAVLDSAYQMCGLGRNQSPINIPEGTPAELEPLTVHYQAGATRILNNRHTVQVDYQPGNVLRMDGSEFVLKQFHFHSPSENKIKGVSYPMEAHLVHADKKGNLAVVAVMFEVGDENALIKALWKKLPKEHGAKVSLGKTPLNVSQILPAHLDYYRFNGSLTTPPCSEGVRWFVLKTPVAVSEEQVVAFEKTMHHANNRPTQPLNARLVLQ